MKIGVEIVTAHRITSFHGNEATLECQYSGRELTLPASSLVVVGQRVPEDSLYQSLIATEQGVAGTLPFTLTRIGDGEAPAIIAANVPCSGAAGHRRIQVVRRGRLLSPTRQRGPRPRPRPLGPCASCGVARPYRHAVRSQLKGSGGSASRIVIGRSLMAGQSLSPRPMS
ncbi:MAG: hypothetical protein WEG56_14850 [Chloroflexota bacterium]